MDRRRSGERFNERYAARRAVPCSGRVGPCKDSTAGCMLILGLLEPSVDWSSQGDGCELQLSGVPGRYGEHASQPGVAAVGRQLDPSIEDIASLEAQTGAHLPIAGTCNGNHIGTSGRGHCENLDLVRGVREEKWVGLRRAPWRKVRLDDPKEFGPRLNGQELGTDPCSTVGMIHH